MQYRTLGKTGLNVSLASYGTGGESQFGQKAGLEQKAQDALIHRCLDLGINLFDTHEAYGNSEEILGRSLKGVPRDSYHLITKWRYHNSGVPKGDAEELARSVERSLSRLNTDYVDIMMIHGIMAADYDLVVERFMPVMDRLRTEGKFRFNGFSTRYIVDPWQESPTLALKKSPDIWDTVMLKYGILNQIAANETLPLAIEHNVGILNMASVRVRLPNPQFLMETIAEWKQKGYLLEDSLPSEDPLGWLVHGDVDSVISAAYKFGAEHPAISTVITGTGSIDHLETNVAALEKPSLPPEDAQRIRDLFGRIGEYA